VQSLDAVRERQARTLVLDWPAGADSRQEARLAELLTTWRGGQCGVALRCETHAASGTLLLGPEWKVRPTLQLLEDLERLCGPARVRLSYAPPVGASSAVSA
jgi:hypothetical protein